MRLALQQRIAPHQELQVIKSRGFQFVSRGEMARFKYLSFSYKILSSKPSLCTRYGADRRRRRAEGVSTPEIGSSRCLRKLCILLALNPS